MLKKKLLVFTVITLLVFGFLSYQSIKGESHLLDLALYPLTFLEEIISSIMRSVDNNVNTYFLLTGKEEENRRLLKKITELEGEINKNSEVRLENERLNKILHLSAQRSDYITTARVFARDPTNWFQTLWINKGKTDGIAKGMVAVGNSGPVGRIHRVFDDRAGVILITDVNSSVAVRLQTSRAEGILEGRGDNSCYLKYVSREVDISVGEKIITSGLDGLYPAGLLIGDVSLVRAEDEMFKVIEVVPAQDLKAVEEVAIFKK